MTFSLALRAVLVAAIALALALIATMASGAAHVAFGENSQGHVGSAVAAGQSSAQPAVEIEPW